ncbi:MAG: hypothetical protein H0U60_11725 [Blastocatellia bacterium]|nr:hypothetical protein [Blastocatellia bacterium]
MKIVGALLIVVGVVALLIGVVACVSTFTSDYASSTCEKAANDKKAFAEAREKCGSTASECYKQATLGLATEDDCDNKKAFMTKQLVMSIVPVVIGALLFMVGALLLIVGFFRGRKKAIA